MPVQSPAMPHRPRSVSGDVGAYLRRLIDTSLSPGDRLPPERELAAELAVSRTTVREALHELESERRVDRRPGRGTVVLAPGDLTRELAVGLDREQREVADVTELRELVEPRLAALAAARAGDGDLALLEQVLADSHAGLSPAESMRLDVEFHVSLARASGNPLLVTLCELASSWTTPVRRRSHATRAGRRTSVEGHRAVLDAVSGRDAVAAEAAMRAHLADVAALAGPRSSAGRQR